MPGKKETKTKINWSDKLNHSTDMLVNRVKQNNSLEELPLIDFDEVAAATNHFSLNSKLGEGGFGPVFKVFPSFVSTFIFRFHSG